MLGRLAARPAAPPVDVGEHLEHGVVDVGGQPLPLAGRGLERRSPGRASARPARELHRVADDARRAEQHESLSHRGWPTGRRPRATALATQAAPASKPAPPAPQDREAEHRAAAQIAGSVRPPAIRPGSSTRASRARPAAERGRASTQRRGGWRPARTDREEDAPGREHGRGPRQPPVRAWRDLGVPGEEHAAGVGQREGAGRRRRRATGRASSWVRRARPGWRVAGAHG